MADFSKTGENKFKRITLLRALEENLGENALESESLRRFINSGAEDQNEKIWLLDRADIIEGTLEKRYGFSLNSFFKREKQMELLIFALLLVISFLSGLASNYLSPDGRVNLLLNPLVLLFLWNLLLYVCLLFSPMVFKKFNSGGFISPLLKRISSYLVRKALPLMPGAERQKAFVSAVLSYQNYCFAANKRSYIIKGRMALGLAGIALAAGVVSGLYLRGLLVDYSFYIETTFTSASQLLESLVSVIFSPVAFAFHVELPAIYGGRGQEWINFLALATLFYVVIPRSIILVLNWFSLLKRRGEWELDLTAGYYRQILAPVFYREVSTALITYDCALDEVDERNILAEFEQEFHGRLSLKRRGSLQWGETFDGQEPEEEGVILLVFNGLETPEEEIHGAVIKSLRGEDNIEIYAALKYHYIAGEELKRRQRQWSEMFKDHGIARVVSYIRGESNEE